MKNFNKIYVLLFVVVTPLACSEKKDTTAYLAQGEEIASSVFSVLSSALKTAMEEGGFDYALEFCNINALPITDSLSKHYGAEIKRTALKFRNPTNAPTEMEIAILNEFIKEKESGVAPKPKVTFLEDNTVHYAQPILLLNQCLVCHGEVEAILPKHYEKILNYYPDDKAVGFKEGSLRGMWSITFNTKR
jgi:hypothetical protein